MNNHHKVSRFPFARWVLFLVLLVLSSCAGDESQSFSEKDESVYSSNHARIFGFEQAQADWGIASSNEASQGLASGQVQSVGGEFSVKNKVALSSLGAVGQQFEIDLLLPQVASWSTLRVVLTSPSQQIWWGELGTLQLSQKVTAGQFSRVSLPLGNLASKLSASYNDLFVQVIVNGPAGVYKFDRITFGGAAVFEADGTGGSSGTGSTTDASTGPSESGGQPSSTTGSTSGDTTGSSTTGSTETGGSGSGGESGYDPGTVRYLSIAIPKERQLEDFIFGAQGGELRVNDNVTLLGRDSLYFADIAAIGSASRARVGVDVYVYNVISRGDVLLRRSNVYGTVVTGGDLEQQLGTYIAVPPTTRATITPYEFHEIAYRYPPAVAPSGYIQNGESRTLQPGGYASTFVQGPSSLKLLSGTYYFDDLKVESGATLTLDNSLGPVLVFVKRELTKRGTMQFTRPNEYNALFTVLGAGPIAISGSFLGTLVAPNASVVLPSRSGSVGHIGSFFAHAIEAHQNTTYKHAPFRRRDCATACGVMFGCPDEPPFKVCDGEPGTTCESDSDCNSGLSCGAYNGDQFGASRSESFCWDPICETDAVWDNCGSADAACGTCALPPRPCEEDSDCVQGDVCGTNNGHRFFGSAPDVCEPEFCSDTPLPSGACGTMESPCGVCECTPNCAQKSCGDDNDDGCGGVCLGLCDTGEGGCLSNLDCPTGDLCVREDSSSKCKPADCVDTNPLSGECEDGVNSCGEPCACDSACQRAKQNKIDSDFPTTLVSSSVGEVKGNLSVSPSGSVSYTVPLKLPPGRGGLAPTIGLAYDSNAGDGPLGPGWRLSGFSQIYRCPTSVAVDGQAGPIRFEDDERTGLCLDGERLIFIEEKDGGYHYRTQLESFREIIARPLPGVAGKFGEFIVRDNQGRTYRYGSTKWSSIDTAQHAPGTVKRVWALDRVDDLNGNWITYSYASYAQGDAPDFPRVLMVPAEVTYSPGDRKVAFKYDERGEGLPVVDRYIAGNFTRSHLRLRSIDVDVPGDISRRYYLVYSPSPSTAEYGAGGKNTRWAWSRLSELYECGLQGLATNCLRPTKFEYIESELATDEQEVSFDFQGTNFDVQRAIVFDANGDTFADVYLGAPGSRGKPQLLLGTGLRYDPFDVRYAEEVPRSSASMSGRNCINSFGVTDYYHDGKQELLDTCGEIEEVGAGRFIWRTNFYEYSDNEGTLTATRRLEFETELDEDIKGRLSPHAMMADLNGDGWDDLILGEEGNQLGLAGIYLTDPPVAPQGNLPNGGRVPNLLGKDYADLLAGVKHQDLALIDIDGDGVVNLVDTGTGSGSPPREFTRYAVFDWAAHTAEWRDTNIGSSLKRYQLGDYNADGLTDICSEGLFRFSTGTGEFVSRTNVAPFGWRTQFAVPVFSPLGTELMLFGEGGPRAYGVPVNGSFIVPPVPAIETTLSTSTEAVAGDFDGDGSNDYLTYHWGGHGPFEKKFHIAFTDWDYHGHLSAVETGLGGRTEIDYSGAAYSVDDSCSFGDGSVVCQPSPGQMVSEVRQFERLVDGSLKSLFHSEYSYRNIRHGLGGHGSYGPEETVVDTYGDDNFIAETAEKTFNNTDWIFAGVVASQVNLSPWSEAPFISDGPRYKNETEVTNSWVRETSDAGRPFPALSKSTSKYFVRSAGEQDPTLLFQKVVDQSTEKYGNIEDRTTSILQPVSAGDPTLRTVYSVAEDFCYEHDPWCDLGPSDPQFARNGLTTLARTARVRKQRLEHDGTLKTVATRFTRTFDPDTGLMMSATRHGTAEQQLDTTLVHDQFGNLVDHIVRTAEGTRQSSRYFDQRGLYPTMLENELGHITYQEFDELSGAIVYYRDENDLETVIDYDAFGRPIAEEDWQKSVIVTYSDPAQAPWTGNWAIRADQHAKMRVSTQVAGGMRRDVDLDAFERTVMSREVGYGGVWVTTTAEYDWRGNMERMARPHAGSSTSGTGTAPGVVQYIYDNWGRLKSEHFPDDTHVRHRYVPKVGAETNNPWLAHKEAAFAEVVSVRTDQDDVEDHERVLVFNALGQVVTSIDAENTRTNYEFGAAGKVTRVEHVAGEAGATNFTSYGHDEYGRTRWMIDPDMGRLDYKYNGFDELTEVRDARGLVTDIHYDDLGRTILQVDNWPDRPAEETAWIYDTADNGVGRLHYTVSPDGVFESAEYYPSGDPQAGLLKSQSLSVEGETYTAAFKYDAYKRLQVVQYPEVAGERFEIVNTYDPTGLLMRVNAAPNGVLDTNRDVWEFKGAHQGYLINDVEVGLSRQHTTFEDTTNRIRGISALTNSSRTVQDLSYDYYPNGDLRDRHDHLNTEQSRESFTYDALHRLELATRDVNDDEVSQDIDYDQLGNIERWNGVRYRYSPTRPHAVTSVGLGTDEETTYGYDAVGNQTSRQGAWVVGGQQQIQYNAFNLPRSITTGSGPQTEETVFKYSASGTRVLKQSNLHESVLFGGLYERVKSFGAQLEETHKYLIYANGSMVAQFSREVEGGTASDIDRRYFLPDALGSVSVITDNAGQLRHQQEFEPFGTSRNPNFSDPGVRYGFTGHAHDADTGLIDMGGRLYDGRLGRFLSADPYVQDPFNLQSHNRYSYAWNNPLSLTDPSGFQNQGPPSDAMMGPTGPSGGGGGCSSGCGTYIGPGNDYSTQIGGQFVSAPGLVGEGQYRNLGGAVQEARVGDSVGVMSHGADGSIVSVGVFVWTGETGNQYKSGWVLYPAGSTQAGADAAISSSPANQATSVPSADEGGIIAGGHAMSVQAAQSHSPQGAGGGPSMGDVRAGLEAAGWIPGPIGSAANAALVGIDIYQGNYGQAAMGMLGIFGGRAATSGVRAVRDAKIVTAALEGVSEVGSKVGGAFAGWAKGLAKGAASAERLAIGRGKDLANGLKAGETKLQWPSKLPDFKAEWKMNSGFLRQWMQKGQPIRDVSPSDTGGMFLNAERNLLQSRGWTFDSGSGYWLPPGG